MTIKDDTVVDIQTPTGRMRTYFIHPAAEGKFPGVVLFSEIFQVTSPIRRTAAMLAGHGYLVAVPEVYHELETPGTVLAYDQAGADKGNAHKYGKELSSYDADARALIDHLKSREDSDVLDSPAGAIPFHPHPHRYTVSSNPDNPEHIRDWRTAVMSQS